MMAICFLSPNCFDIYSHFVKLDWLFSPSHFVIVIFRSVWICDKWQIATKPWLLLMDLLFSLCKKNFELLPPLNFNRKRFKYFRKFNFSILVINFVCWHFANIDILCSNRILGSFHLNCQARLLLLFIQISKLNSQSLNSEVKGTELSL